MMKEEAKEISFSRSEKSVEGMSIFADHEVGEEANFFSKQRKMIEGGDRNEQFVADALAVNHGASGPRLGEGAFKEGDHLRRLPERFGRRRLYGGGG
jgi:hypothetical protein